MLLTAAQVEFFNTFGYLVVRQLLSAAEVDRITAGFEWSIQNHGGGSDHDGSSRTMFGGPIEHTPEMCALLDHPGILGLIGGGTGADFNYCSGDGNYYSGDTLWHPDGDWGQLWATKTTFYLDPVGRESGCLRVIPGSHHPDHFVRKNKITVNDAETLHGIAADEFPGQIALESDPGDVVIFTEAATHGTLPSQADHQRRSFLLRFSPGNLAYAKGYLPDWPENILSKLTAEQRAVFEPPYHKRLDRPTLDDNGALAEN